MFSELRYGLQDYYFHIRLKTLGEVGAVSQLIASMIIQNLVPDTYESCLSLGEGTGLY